MPIRAFQLRLTSPLHIGDMGIAREETLTHVPSDTLFSALAVTWLELPAHAHRTRRLHEHFKASPPLLLSSAFPYVGETRLLPKPHLSMIPGTGQTQESPKAYKRVHWVSTGVFAQLTHNLSQDTLDAAWAEGKLLQDNSIWITAAEFGNLPHAVQEERQIWGEMRVPKVTVDRTRSASALFHVGRVHFAPECGLWCMAQGTPDWLDAMQIGLELLGDSGLGGQRSKGNGQFQPANIDAPLELNTHIADAAPQQAYQVLLSRCAPTKAQMSRLTAPGAAYQLTTIGGFNGTPGDAPLIRKQVRMLSEGSIIAAGEEPTGALVNVTPNSDEVQLNHEIYRYGFGLGAPLVIPQSEISAPHVSTPEQSL